MSEFRAMNKGSVVDEVLAQMMGKIADGTWSRGEKIPSENELRELLGVSRDTVRQAIKQMCAQGLLESQQGRGTYVKNADVGLPLTQMIPTVFLTQDDGANLIEFMQVIETASASIAAEKATEEDLAYLQSCLDQMIRAETDEQYYDWDSKYHIHLAKCTRNPLFSRSIEITSEMLTYYFTNLAKVHGREASIAQHRSCLEAVRTRDQKAAYMAMREHYEMLGRRLQQALTAKQPD